VPPQVTGITLSPDTVKYGETSIGTVTLDNPSLLGSVIVDLICGSGSVTVPNQVSIPQNQLSISFPITTVDLGIKKTGHAVIYAKYDGTSVWATLTMQPKVIVGVLQSLTLFPSTGTGGVSSNGTVTLEGPVPTDSTVSLAAVETGIIRPDPNNAPSDVNIPVGDTVTIPAGQISQGFGITTKKLPAHSKRTATIIASAVVTKYEILTVIS